MPSTTKSTAAKGRRQKEKEAPGQLIGAGYLTAKSKSKVSFPKAVPDMIHFLRKVHEFPCLYLNRAILKEAVRRYEVFWIPLLASVEQNVAPQLIPPLDVEWVLHCHMLAPHHYRLDMVRVVPSSAHLENMFARTVLSPTQREVAKRRSKDIWTLHSPGEPYDIEEVLAAAPPESQENEKQPFVDSRLEFDFFAAAEKQIAFYYQIAVMPQYEDQLFLETAVYQYLDCFLRLKKDLPEKKLVPSRAIAAVWCAHVLHPGLYHGETSAMFGEMLHYDDNLDAGLTGTDLILSLRETQFAWAQTFNERGPATYGEMWRGKLTTAEFKVRSLLARLVSRYEESWGRQNVSTLETTESFPEEDLSLLSFDQLGISWVHSQSLRNCQTASGGVLHRVSGISERYSDLLMQARNGRQVPVLCSHIVSGLGITEKPGLVVLAQLGYVEIYSGGAADLSSADIPLASAERLHYALPRVPKDAKKEEPWHQGEGDESVLLRVAGEDVAILKFKPTGEIISLKDRMARSRLPSGIRRQYDLFFCPLRGKQRGKGLIVRLSKVRGKASEASKVSASFLNPETFPRNETFVISKRSTKFSEWDIHCSSSKSVLVSFLIAVAESMIEIGNEQYTRECCRRKAESYDKDSEASASSIPEKL